MVVLLESVTDIPDRVCIWFRAGRNSLGFLCCANPSKTYFLESCLWKVGHSPSNYYEESEKNILKKKHLNFEILNLENVYKQRLQLKYWIK